MSGTKPIFEIFEEVRAAEDKVAALKPYENNAVLRTILRGIFDPQVKFLLPEGPLPDTFKPNVFDFESKTFLYNQAKRFYLFIEGGHPTLTEKKRQELFIDLCEGIHPKDVEILVAMKDKKSPVEGLTKRIVLKAFPELF